NGCSGGLPPATTVISTIAVATVSPSTACTATLAPRTEEGGTGVVRSRRRNPDSRCIPKVWGIDITPVTVTENLTIGEVQATITLSPPKASTGTRVAGITAMTMMASSGRPTAKITEAGER